MNQVPNGFIDLNLNLSKLTTKELNKLLNELIEYGYRVLAFNTLVDLEVLHGPQQSKAKKKKSGPAEDPIPLPITHHDINEEISSKIKILQRITVKYSEPGQVIKLKDSKNFKQYQIFAVQPSSISAFSHACSILEVDIISFGCEDRLSFPLSRKMYQVAVQRGIHFEVCYSSLIVSSDSRIHCIQTCHLISISGKSKALILSSGASHSLHVRSPHEIQSMALLLGLSHVQAKQSIESYPRAVLLRAYGRRLGKTLFNIEETPSEETNVDESSLPPSLKKLKMEE